MVGSSEHGNGISGTLKEGKILDLRKELASNLQAYHKVTIPEDCFNSEMICDINQVFVSRRSGKLTTCNSKTKQ
jgi:hypothetical protein